MKVYPVERIDKWMEVDNWNKTLISNFTVTKNEQTRDGSSMIRIQADNLPATGAIISSALPFVITCSNMFCIFLILGISLDTINT